MLTNFIKQPLFHFILAGALIFIWYQISGETPESDEFSREISVTREDLLEFMQYRAQAFEPESFAERLDNLSPAQRQALIEEFVREEALYREALAMGMERGDYIIRQRLVQKVEFLLENMVTASINPDDEMLAEFYQDRRDDYLVDTVYTFTHIFFDGEKRGWEEAKAAAENLLQSDTMANVLFNDASQYGDRYPFLQNYVERTRDFVANNFSDAFVQSLDNAAVNEQRWQGVFESRYGFHLVLLTRRIPAYIPPLDAIYNRVADDYRYEKTLEQKREAENKVVNEYEIDLLL